MQAELLGIPQIGPSPCRANDAFRWHTADIQTVATHQMFFDQGHFGPQTRGNDGGDQPRRPSPNDHNIVAASRFGIDPVRGMHVADEHAVMLVVRQHETLFMLIHHNELLW